MVLIDIFKSVKMGIGGEIVLLRDRLILHSVLFGKLGMDMNFREFLGKIYAKNLHESGILSPLWEALQ